MKKEINLILIIGFTLIFLNAGLSFAQEQATQLQTIVPTEPEVQWLWGEVISVDSQNQTILVKYFDYEKGIDKEISINVDDKTTYENVKSIDEIKPSDAVSVDYIVSPEGKNIARDISVEKPEGEQVIQEETTEKPKPMPSP